LSISMAESSDFKSELAALEGRIDARLGEKLNAFQVEVLALISSIATSKDKSVDASLSVIKPVSMVDLLLMELRDLQKQVKSTSVERTVRGYLQVMVEYSAEKSAVFKKIYDAAEQVGLVARLEKLVRGMPKLSEQWPSVDAAAISILSFANDKLETEALDLVKAFALIESLSQFKRKTEISILLLVLLDTLSVTFGSEQIFVSASNHLQTEKFTYDLSSTPKEKTIFCSPIEVSRKDAGEIVNTIAPQSSKLAVDILQEDKVFDLKTLADGTPMEVFNFIAHRAQQLGMSLSSTVLVTILGSQLTRVTSAMILKMRNIHTRILERLPSATFTEYRLLFSEYWVTPAIKSALAKKMQECVLRDSNSVTKFESWETKQLQYLRVAELEAVSLINMQLDFCPARAIVNSIHDLHLKSLAMSATRTTVTTTGVISYPTYERLFELVREMVAVNSDGRPEPKVDNNVSLSRVLAASATKSILSECRFCGDMHDRSDQAVIACKTRMRDIKESRVGNGAKQNAKVNFSNIAKGSSPGSSQVISVKRASAAPYPLDSVDELAYSDNEDVSGPELPNSNCSCDEQSN
jgi:hypothetical protein